MKKLFILLVISIFLPAVSVAAKEDTRSKIEKIISKYDNKEGFETVSIGGLGLSLLKTFAAVEADDPEERMALSAAKGLKRIVVVDFEDCGYSLRSSITRDFESFFDSLELLLEVNDEDEKLKIYGNASDDSKIVKDLIVYSNEGTVVYLSGTLNLDNLQLYVNVDEGLDID